MNLIENTDFLRASLQALYDRINLKPFDGCEPRLVVLDRARLEDAVGLAVQEFSRYVGPLSVYAQLRCVNPDLSIGIDAGGRLIGVYLVSASNLYCQELPLLRDRRGLQGDALVVHPPARGRGYGHVLRELLPQVGQLAGADYVWGGALAELNNLNHWLRRRILIRPGWVNITLEPIAHDLKEVLLPLAHNHLRERWVADLAMSGAHHEMPFSSNCPGA